MPPPSERRTSQPYEGYASTMHYSTAPPGVRMEQKSQSKFLSWSELDLELLIWQSSTQSLDHRTLPIYIYVWSTHFKSL